MVAKTSARSRPLFAHALRHSSEWPIPSIFLQGHFLDPSVEFVLNGSALPSKILSQADIDELRDIVDYGNLFHHDTNAAWETEIINSTQLEGFVRRTLAFAKRP